MKVETLQTELADLASTIAKDPRNRRNRDRIQRINEIERAIHTHPEVIQYAEAKARKRNDDSRPPKSEAPAPLKITRVRKKGNETRTTFSPGQTDYIKGIIHLEVATPIMEAVSHTNDHGFRPYDGIETTLAQIHRELVEGKTFVTKTDIDECFPTIPVGTTVALPYIPEKLGRKTIILSRQKRELQPGPEGQGLPQGHPLSPPMVNIAINSILAKPRRQNPEVAIIRYADDIIMAGNEAAANRALRDIETELQHHRMNINYDKTSQHRATKGNRIPILGYTVEHENGHTLFRPRPRAYKRLADKCDRAHDRKHLQQIIAGWLNAYRLTNAPDEIRRAKDFVKMLDPTWPPEGLRAPRWGEIQIESIEVPNESAYIAELRRQA